MKRRAGFSVLLVAVGACGGGPADPAELGMVVTVTVSPQQSTLGDTVVIAVDARNTSGERVSLSFLGPCSVGFEVLDAAGTVVAPVPPVCPIIDWVSTLEPGQAIGLEFDWLGERQYGTGDFIAPGTYRVRGLLDARSSPLRSEPVTVELREAP